MMRRTGRIATPAALALLLLVVAGGVGVGLGVLANTRRILTDAETIRVPASDAPVRDILWQPARALADWPDSGVDEYEPRLSPDGQTMLLVRGRPGENADILIAERRGGAWSEPAPLDALNSPSDDLGPTFAPDGGAIYFYSDRAGGLGGFDLWVSRRDARSRWGAPEHLGEGVNSAFNEYGPAVSPDGATLYFSSNRPNEKPDDGLGADRWSATIREDHIQRDYDLYAAALTEGAVGPARALDDLNTRWNEGAPAPSPPGDFLYFASDRPGGPGGFDLYRARMVRGEILAPLRLDDSVNSSANDLDPALSMGGYELHFSSDRAAGEDGARRYRLYVSRSREVFAETERAEAGLDWDALAGPLLWLLLLLLLLLLALLLARQAREDARWRRLSLLAKCLLASLLAHALLLYLLAFWQVAASIGEALRRPGGRQVIIASSAGADSLRSQVRGGITQLTFTAQDQAGAETPEFARLLDAATRAAALDAPAVAATAPQRVARAEATDAATAGVATPTEIRAEAPEREMQTFDAPSEVRIAQADEARVSPEAQSATSAAAPVAPASVQAAQAALEPDAAPSTAPEPVVETAGADAPALDPRAAPTTIAPEAPSASVALAAPQAPAAQQAHEREVALDASDARSSESPAVDAPAQMRVATVDAPVATEAAPAPVVSAEASDALAPTVEPTGAVTVAPAPPALAGIEAPAPDDGAPTRAVGEETLAIDPETAEPDGATIAAPIVESASRPSAIAPDDAPPEAPAPVVAEATPTEAQPSAPAPTEAPALAALTTDAPAARVDLDGPHEGARGAVAEADAPAPAIETAPSDAAPLLEAVGATPTVALDAQGAPEAPTASLAELPNGPDARPATDAPAVALAPIALPEAIALDAPAPSEQGAVANAERAPDALAPETARSVDALPLVAAAPAIALPEVAPDAAAEAAALESLATPSEVAMESSAATDTPAPATTIALDLPALGAVGLETPAARAGADAEESALDALAPDLARGEAPGAAIRVDAPAPALAQVAPDVRAPADSPLAPEARASEIDPRHAPLLAPMAASTPSRTPGAIEPNLLLPMELAPPAAAYAQRDEAVRQEIVEQMGGSKETEAAVANALAWLAARQSAAGAWDADDPNIDCDDCGGVTNIQSDIALTGLALLCFLGADHTHTQPGMYQDTVRRGLEWLVAQQRSDGDLRGRESMYSHGIATIALAEAYGMTGDPALRERVTKAVDFIIDARNREVGGWRYAPRQLGDTSVLGWQVMALVSARRAGVDVPDAILGVAGSWLNLVDTRGRPGLYAYQPGERPTFAMTAEGMFVRQLLGDEADADHMANSAEFVLRELPDWSRDANTYGWYYATLAMYQHQGESWRRWNEALSRELLARQEQDGPGAGSWAPADRWSLIGGRIYQTAICTLSLEVYYRYLPRFMQADARPVPDADGGR